MCGRITLTATIQEIKEHFALKQASAALIPRYNIAPSQFVVIVKGSTLEFASWGFKMVNSASSIINAKIETALEKRCFSSAFKKQRCLIVGNGFFEWKVVGKQKVPFYIQVKNQTILGFAGIFIKDTCVILTTATDNNKYIDAIHNRVPVIINSHNYHLWLNVKTPAELLLNPDLQINQQDFFMHPVSSQVNNPRFDDIVCIKSLI